MKIRFLTLLTLLTLLAGCDEPTDGTAGDADPVPVDSPAGSQSPLETQREALFGDAVITADVSGKWARSCSLCHVTGEGGAPRIGNKSEWQARLVQGEQALMIHTIEGFNKMPPLGYCMGCEREDLRAMIKLMIGTET